jgi:hypothetical protein
VADVQAVGGRIEAGVVGDRAGVEAATQPLGVDDLLDDDADADADLDADLDVEGE